MTKQTLLLKGAEVAEELGVSRALAYRMMGDGTLPTVRRSGGRMVRVPREALTEWVRSNTRSSGAKQGSIA